MGALELLDEEHQPTLGERAVDALPMFGGTIGGLVGRPLGGLIGGGAGAAAGLPFAGIGALPAGAAGLAVGQEVGATTLAGLGAAGGEALREMLTGEGLQAQKILKEGGTQAAYEAAGGLAFRGAGLAARGLMASSIGRGGMEVANTALQEAFPWGQKVITTTRGGVQRLLRRIGAATNVRNQIFESARRQGIRFDPKELVAGSDQLLREAKSGALEEGTRAIRAMTKRFTRLKNQQLTPEALWRIIRDSDEKAKPILEAIQKKIPVSQIDNVYAKWHSMIAQRGRELIHGVEDQVTGVRTGGIPGLAEANARLAQLARVREAIAPVTRRARPIAAAVAPRASAGLVGGVAGASVGGGSSLDRAERGLIGMAAGAAIGMPQVVSFLAHVTNNPALLEIIRQGPRAAGAYAESQQ